MIYAFCSTLYCLEMLRKEYLQIIRELNLAYFSENINTHKK